MKFVVVDPQNDPRLIPWIQDKVKDGCPTYNLLSILEIGVRLDKLIPKKSVMDYLLLKMSGEEDNGDGYDKLFDQAYAAQIIGDDATFIHFMTLMSGVVGNEDVILISNYSSPSTMVILDSLLKLIKERYGLSAFLINELDDLNGLSLESSSIGDLNNHMVYSDDICRYNSLTNMVEVGATPEEIAEDTQSMLESMQTEAPIVGMMDNGYPNGNL